MSKFSVLKTAVAAALLFVSANSISASESIAERIAPVAHVCVEGVECATAQVAAAASNDGPRSAEDIFKNTCNLCHSGAIPNAPKFGDKAAWAPRIAQGKETLYSHAINGLNGAMPPRGTCATCSDDEIKSVVDYMVEAAQ